MLHYYIQRFLFMILILLVVSVVGFIIIQLPPGDFLSSYIATLEMTGAPVDDAQKAALIKQYGLDSPIYLQYFKWMGNMFQGDFGMSFSHNKPVIELIGERLGLTVSISLFTLFLTYIVAIPIGIYSATHQYSFGDYSFTAVGFVGVATPPFLLALILMFFFNRFFGLNVGGLFSSEYVHAPWSPGKVLDLVNHLWVPVITIGAAGLAFLIRIMRGCLLDELQKQYVITARAKGLSEGTLLFKYPVRIALNPIVSCIGWVFPLILSGEIIVAVTLNLPTTGPLFLHALLSQDMYLAGSIMMLLSALTVVGVFVSDLLLVWLDPRIRFEKISGG